MGLFDYDVLPGILAPRLQNTIQPSMPRAMPTNLAPRPAAPMPQQSIFQRLLGGIGGAIAGPDDGRLDMQSNLQARRSAMLQAGLALMASQPGQSTLGNIGNALQSGMQAGGEVREQAYMRTAEERLAQALNDPMVMSKLTPEQAAMIRLMPPAEAAKLLTQLAFAPKAGPSVVSKGGALVGADGKVLYESPPEGEKLDLPSEMKAALFKMGVTDPNQLDPQARAMVFALAEQYRRSGATTVNVQTPGQQSTKGMTESMVKLYDSIQGEATAAEGRIDSLRIMESLLDQGVATGRMQDLTSNLRGIAADFGIANSEKLAGQELFKSVTNKLMLDVKRDLPGTMSDKDIEFLEKQVPRIGMTAEGNRVLIEVMKRVEQRKVQLADLADQYARTNGDLMGWRQFRSQWLRTNPLDLSDLYGRQAPWKTKK
jgi:hypothetical protein